MANPTADFALAAIDTAVKAAGYDSWKIEFGVVKVPARLRGWSAGAGVLPTAYVSIGLDALVTTYTTAKSLQVKRQNELDGLVYVIAQTNSILCQDVDFELATAAADFNTLLSMLSDINSSMAE